MPWATGEVDLNGRSSTQGTWKPCEVRKAKVEPTHVCLAVVLSRRHGRRHAPTWWRGAFVACLKP